MENKYIDGFTAAEWSGRTFQKQIFEERGIKGFTFTETRFDAVDVFWDKDGSLYVGEIKYRPNYDSTGKCIVDEGVLLEKVKYDALKSYQYNSGMTPYYIMFFRNGEVLLYDLTDFDSPQWVETDLPKTTMGDKKKVKKVVTYLPVDIVKSRYRYKVTS